MCQLLVEVDFADILLETKLFTNDGEILRRARPAIKLSSTMEEEIAPFCRKSAALLPQKLPRGHNSAAM